MADKANCEIGVGALVNNEKDTVIDFDKGAKKIKVKSDMKERKIISAEDEAGAPIQQIDITPLTQQSLPGDRKFPPDEFVMYSQSSPGCAYYYINGRLVYR